MAKASGMAKAKRRTRAVQMNSGASTEMGILDPGKVYDLPVDLAAAFVRDGVAEWADPRAISQNAPPVTDDDAPPSTDGEGDSQ